MKRKIEASDEKTITEYDRQWHHTRFVRGSIEMASYSGESGQISIAGSK